MKAIVLSDTRERREWAIIFDAGDEAVAQLQHFAAAHQLMAAHFTGIGAFSKVTVAWFDLEKRQYHPIDIDEQVEVLSLLGDVAEFDGKPAVHAHICVAKRDGGAHGGHLQYGWVRPTLELIVTESPAHLRKSFRPEFGIPLIDPGRSTAAAGSESLSI